MSEVALDVEAIRERLRLIDEQLAALRRRREGLHLKVVALRRDRDRLRQAIAIAVAYAVDPCQPESERMPA